MTTGEALIIIWYSTFLAVLCSFVGGLYGQPELGIGSAILLIAVGRIGIRAATGRYL